MHRNNIPGYNSAALTADEKVARAHFIDAFTADYDINTPSDRLILSLAASEYVKSLRLQEKELETGTILTAARQHPINQLLRLLEAMDATRKARQQAKPGNKDEENELREWLLSKSVR